MRRLIVTLAAAALAAAACGGGAPAASPTSAAPTVPAAKPSSGTETTPPANVPALLKFQGRTLDGKPFDGSSLAAKPVVLWFWAPWCPKCQGEGPAVAKAARKYGDKVAFVGVAGLDKNKGQMDAFVARTGTGGLVHLDDRGGDLYRHFKVTSQSSYLFVNPAGGGHKATGPLSESELSELVDAHAM
ncbi:TlpA family protein disulfide reductase [Actinomadura sp. 9N407]|uniref:TlpA family protein disulfide reductase n=1 Tax=Actinomadura sp. 9N407 TaxID=3375154 RepID=UPI00379ADC3F